MPTAPQAARDPGAGRRQAPRILDVRWSAALNPCRGTGAEPEHILALTTSTSPAQPRAFISLVGVGSASAGAAGGPSARGTASGTVMR